MFRPILVILCTVMAIGLFVSHKSHAYRNYSSAQSKRLTPYSINGKRYKPLSSQTVFVQEGTASWYGSDFHGKETSSGEVYDMHAMTAAHKTLPLGVFVKVQNRRNGREIVVRVNDRGPFVDGRIIDLSYSAARNLGFVKSGIAPVQIEALGYYEKALKGKASYRAPLSYDSGSFAIQVGSCISFENAQVIADDMKRQNVLTTIREAVVRGEKYHRVHAGNYLSLREAELARKYSANRLINKGFVVALD